LHCALNLLLLATHDVLADGFGGALYRFRGHLQTGQQLHLLAAVIEGRLLADQRVHAPHARRRVGVLDVQFAVGGELALAAMRTQIPGTCDLHRTQGRHHAPRAQLAVTRLVTAGTRKRALLFVRLAETQQVAEGGGAGMLQGSAEGHLHCFQIRLASLLAVGEDARQQRSYFTRDLALDRLGRFFSSGVSVSSTGRARQIFSLISNRSRLSSRNR
jgi:hypothetical protein